MKTMSRRKVIKQIAGAAATAAVVAPRLGTAAEGGTIYKARNNRINQSVVHWCFKPMSVEELAIAAARMGCKSVELVGPEHWTTLKKHGLICAISGSHGFAKGFAHREEHEQCIAALRKSIDATAEEGWPSVITFSGFRRGISDEEGIKNMVEGLKKIVGHAEKKKVTLCLEMLNSRVNIEMKGHPDYFCDDIDRSVEICRQISSERMKVLFDIYHVQIMHGDVITRLRQCAPYIGHYHTAGVPGRAEIDDTQEINYAPIMKAIVETGYKGYVAQEFIPVHDKVASLNQSVQICDV
jgi:hydroxypyruvate isomerase